MTLWKGVAKQTLYTACTKNFQQNPELAQKLKQTKGKIIEANPKDTFFSCGLRLGDPKISDPSKWKGQNELGDILCKLRDSL